MEDKNISIRFPASSTLLGIAFIVLKLCDVIAWPWIWVLAPFWVGLAIWMFFFIVVLIIAAFNR